MKIAIRTNSELLLECGYYKPPSVVDLNDKEEIVKAVSLHHVIFKSKAELDQLKDGLQTLGVGMQCYKSNAGCILTVIHS